MEYESCFLAVELKVYCPYEMLYCKQREVMVLLSIGPANPPHKCYFRAGSDEAMMFRICGASSAGDAYVLPILYGHPPLENRESAKVCPLLFTSDAGAPRIQLRVENLEP